LLLLKQAVADGDDEAAKKRAEYLSKEITQRASAIELLKQKEDAAHKVFLENSRVKWYDTGTQLMNVVEIQKRAADELQKIRSKQLKYTRERVAYEAEAAQMIADAELAAAERTANARGREWRERMQREDAERLEQIRVNTEKHERLHVESLKREAQAREEANRELNDFFSEIDEADKMHNERLREAARLWEKQIDLARRYAGLVTGRGQGAWAARLGSMEAAGMVPGVPGSTAARQSGAMNFDASEMTRLLGIIARAAEKELRL
jgi:hypothetical protein